MKITYELTFADQDFPLYTLRAAELFERMAHLMRAEADGGPVIVTRLGWALSVEDVGSIELKGIEPS